jgi:hypothetical protein
MSAAKPRSVPANWMIGYGVPCIALLIYAGYWLLYRYGPWSTYFALLSGLGIRVGSHPFLDSEAVLSAIGCARQGVDVTLPNACMGGGLFQYSPLLLKAAALPLATAQRVPFGLCMDLAFLLSLFALPRPQRWGDFWLLLLAALSSSTLFAIERANIDLIIYVLILGAVLLTARSGVARFAAYAIVLGAAALKFYPASLMILALREKPWRFMAIALVSVAGALVLYVSYAGGIGHVMARLPQGDPFIDIFSASNLPLGIAMLCNNGDASHGAGLAVWTVSVTALVALCGARAFRLALPMLADLRVLEPLTQTLLVAGAMSILFCFFAAKNVHYREIFLIMTLPGLWTLQRIDPAPRLAARYLVTAWVVVTLLWSEFFRISTVAVSNALVGGEGALLIQMLGWVLREAAWWWLMITLASVVGCFVWDSPVLRVLRRQFKQKSASF